MYDYAYIQIYTLLFLKGSNDGYYYERNRGQPR